MWPMQSALPQQVACVSAYQPSTSEPISVSRSNTRMKSAAPQKNVSATQSVCRASTSRCANAGQDFTPRQQDARRRRNQETRALHTGNASTTPNAHPRRVVCVSASLGTLTTQRELAKNGWPSASLAPRKIRVQKTACARMTRGESASASPTITWSAASASSVRTWARSAATPGSASTTASATRPPVTVAVSMATFLLTGSVLLVCLIFKHLLSFAFSPVSMLFRTHPEV